MSFEADFELRHADKTIDGFKAPQPALPVGGIKASKKRPQCRAIGRQEKVHGETQALVVEPHGLEAGFLVIRKRSVQVYEWKAAVLTITGEERTERVHVHFEGILPETFEIDCVQGKEAAERV